LTPEVESNLPNVCKSARVCVTITESVYNKNSAHAAPATQPSPPTKDHNSHSNNNMSHPSFMVSRKFN
jgi:hypothetical protein